MLLLLFEFVIFRTECMWVCRGGCVWGGGGVEGCLCVHLNDISNWALHDPLLTSLFTIEVLRVVRLSPCQPRARFRVLDHDQSDHHANLWPSSSPAAGDNWTRDLTVLWRSLAVKITSDFYAKRLPQNQPNLPQTRRISEQVIKGHNKKHVNNNS